MDDLVASRLGHAIVGVDVDLPPVGSPAELLAALATADWDLDRIRTHAAERRRQGEPWPHPVPLAWLREYGAARWAATIGDVVTRIGTQTSTAERSERPLSTDERRLLAEVPPHHGS
jgi:hypothetical protein